MDDFMRQAFDAAERGYTTGNTPVGSVVVKDATVIGTGYNQQRQKHDPTSHAELEAIRDASARAGTHSLELFADAVCYTTMMPCAMCAGALIRFGFTKVVVAETTSYTPSGAQQLMRNQGVIVEVHQYEECIALSSRYAQEHAERVRASQAHGRPQLKTV